MFILTSSATRLDATESPHNMTAQVDLAPRERPATKPLDSPLALNGIDANGFSTTLKILDIINRYRLEKRTGTDTRVDEGTLRFLSAIYSYVKAETPIQMCLPAFPFKSPNTELKVLGRLPDKAEDIALAHLNGLCAAIGDIYKPGAKLTIISDGLVYNDLLGVPDREVWAYGEALRAIAASRGYQHIEFSRLKDLVRVSVPDQLDEITYVANATNFRHALLSKFARVDWDSSQEISKSEDTCLTYRGYIKFLETDLKNVYPVGNNRSKSKFKSGIEYIAKQMLARGDAFARAVRENFRNHLRLSIHPSTGEAKLSISLLPTETAFTTPWHCSIAFTKEGNVITGPRRDFDTNPTFELVYENGRPSYYRERTELLYWSSQITCEPLYPCGLMIRPAAGPKTMSIEDVDAAKLRALAELNSPVVLRGFARTDQRDLFVKKAEELGTPLPWKFGLVLEVKDKGADTGGLNNVLSAEWMPFHFDGLFKTAKRVREDGSEELYPTPPSFQFFTSVTPSPNDTGFTLFSPSRLVFKYLPVHLPLSYLSKLTWSVGTSSFNATKLKGLSLVVPHPSTGTPSLRYHEPWPQSKTMFDATHVDIEGVTESESTAICEALDSLLHDRRVCYWHAWENGDLLVSDNISMMHTRSEFRAGASRELWRIHFD